jgi:hypothetical protein
MSHKSHIVSVGIIPRLQAGQLRNQGSILVKALGGRAQSFSLGARWGTEEMGRACSMNGGEEECI